ncbi:hypothetical protein FRC01_007258, partial [Tulasnella sp. 417]
MNRLSEADSSPRAQPWNSQALEPGNSAAYEGTSAEESRHDEARAQPLRTLPGIAVGCLPAEVWTAVCEALRQLDLIDSVEKYGLGLIDARPTATNTNRPDPIFTAHSILRLSQTCRYLHQATSPSVMEYIRVCPIKPIRSPEWSCRSPIGRIKSLHLNSDQRLKLVRGFAVGIDSAWIFERVDPIEEPELRSQIHDLLIRLPNLHHLTVAGIALDAPLMQRISTLPLEHLGLRIFGLDNSMTHLPSTPMTEPKVKLRSLVAYDCSTWGKPKPDANWVRQLMGPTLQDLTLDGSFWNPSDLPVLPDLEFLRIPHELNPAAVSPSMLSGLLSGSPNLKEAVLLVPLGMRHPYITFPELPHLQHIYCPFFWLRYLVPGRPITTATVMCDPWVQLEKVCEILSEGSGSLRDLSLDYSTPGPEFEWSPDELEPVVRHFPELETLCIATAGHK